MRFESFFASAVSCARKFLVPERAIVPRLATSSSSLMPTPVSAMVSVFFSSSSVRSIRGSNGSDLYASSTSVRWRSLSSASEEFEINSRRKNLGMGVEGVDDQLQQLTDFGLKLLFSP